MKEITKTTVEKFDPATGNLIEKTCTTVEKEIIYQPNVTKSYPYFPSYPTSTGDPVTY